jgi:hypothetical protein
MNAINPNAWKKCIKLVQNYPEAKKSQHLYASSPGYESCPYTYAHMLTLCYALAKIATDKSLPRTGDIERAGEAASCALVALASDAPFRHLGAELARAFIATKPLPFAGEAQMPYPAFVLNLPKGLLRDDTNSNVNTVIVLSYNFWRSKCNEKGIKVYGDTEIISNGGLQVVGLADDGTQLVRTVSWSDAHIERFDDMVCSNFDPNLVAKAVHRMMRIVLNSMSAMTWRKDLLETQYVTAGAGFAGKKSTLRQRPVYWIGKNYVRKQKATTNAESTGGVKSPHWRSGHWHTVKHGQGRLKAKVLWFEPIYVNAATNP